MDFKKHALILSVIESLNRHNSWTGKTHVQKALYLLQATGAEVPFQFILYKHGPYSFDVENELEQMKSYAAIKAAVVGGYGVMFEPSVNADLIRKQAPLSEPEKQKIDRIGQLVRNKPVTDLERLATAAWIRQSEKITDAQQVATRLNQLKPHIAVEDAMKADAEVLPLLSASISA